MGNNITVSRLPKISSYIKFLSSGLTKNNVVVETVSTLNVLLFVYAAISKLIDHHDFQVELGKSPLLTSYASLVALAIPVTELILSFLLVFSRTRLVGLYCSFGLMSAFTFYIIAITQFSEFVPCSCGGILEQMSWTQHLIFNIIFVILNFIGILVSPKT
jgi:hypothetical protein